MKTFAAATLVALTTFAAAQLPNVPSCALNCFITPLTTDGCSDISDFKCHCQKADSLFASVTPCVQKACSAEDQAETISQVEKTCAENGVTVDVPTPGGSSTPAPSSTPSKTPSPSATPTPTTVATVASSVTSETPSASSHKSSATPTPTPSGNATSPSSSSSVSEFPGAAPRITQAAGLLGAAAIALFAL